MYADGYRSLLEALFMPDKWGDKPQVGWYDEQVLWIIIKIWRLHERFNRLNDISLTGKYVRLS